jgi:hypothetical protein
MLTLVSCPECHVPAEITERFTLPSTDGPVDHVVVCCAAGHHFRMPSELLEVTELLDVTEPLDLTRLQAAIATEADRPGGGS